MSEPAELPAIAGEALSVVLPTRNAAGCLEQILGEWRRCLEERGRPSEVILVDAGSTDDTGVLAEKLAAEWPALRVIRQPEPEGLGTALRIGLAAARHPLIVYTTADGQYGSADLPELLKWIDKVELVCGQRRRPWPARLGAIRERLGRWLIRVLFGLRLKDPQCVYVLARRSAFRRTPIQSAGAFAHVEILAKANFLGCLMTDVPVSYRPPAKGQRALTSSPARQTIDEARHLLAHPDFGPPFLFEETPWACAWVREMSPLASLS